MKLRTQLLLAGAMTLLVPLVAYRAIQQLDTALRESRTVELSQRLDSARTLLKFSSLIDGLKIRSAPMLQDQLTESPKDELTAKRSPKQAGNQTNLSAESDKRDLNHPNSPEDTPGATATDVEAPIFTADSPWIYAEFIKHRIVLDGYADDWVNNELQAVKFKETGNNASNSEASKRGVASVSLRAAVTATHLYLFFDVPEDKVIYHDPGLGVLTSGDHIELFQRIEGAPLLRSVFRAVAPGSMIAYRYGKKFEGLQPILPVNSYRAAWSLSDTGYQLEVRLPKPAAYSGLGFSLIDKDRGGDVVARGWVGTTDPDNPTVLPRVVYPSAKIRELMMEVVPPGSRARIFDQNGFLRAEANRLYEKAENATLLDPRKSNIFNAVLFRFFEWLIRKKQLADGASFTSESRYVLDAEHRKFDTQTRTHSYTTLQRDHVIGALASIEKTAVNQNNTWILYETNEDNANAFTSSAMVRLFSLITFVSLLVAISLLLFATWLSWRIRKLSKAARSAVTREGKMGRTPDRSSARDEIGDLSRDFASLVERSAGYNQYLESLASRLSHELRTPLSVVKTSLENLDNDSISESNRLLLQRALGGSEQLDRLVRSMSEATRLEQTVENAEFQNIDLVAWLQNVAMTYRDIYPQSQFHVTATSTPLVARCVPELLQQALDKLVSNAVDFTPPGGLIALGLGLGTDWGSVSDSDWDSVRNIESGLDKIRERGPANHFPGLTDEEASRDKRFGTREGLVRISVFNEGSHLPEEHMDKLFEPMVSSRKSIVPAVEHSSASAPHLGLGLYIVRLVAEAHGGRAFARKSGRRELAIYDKSRGEGVVFGFTLRQG